MYISVSAKLLFLIKKLFTFN